MVIDFDAAETRVMELQAEQRRAFAGNDRSKQLVSWIDAQSIPSMHFHLMLRPGGNVPYANAKAYFKPRTPAMGLT